MNLFENTYDLVRQIPNGKVSTYGNVAKALGDIHAARAVGRMMNQNPNADEMPCFRIVYSDGKIGIKLNLSSIYPKSDSQLDKMAVYVVDSINNRWFLDPVFKGSYPRVLLSFLKKRFNLPQIPKNDLTLLKENPMDFF